MFCVNYNIGVMISLCLLSIFVSVSSTEPASVPKKVRCATEPTAAKKVEKVIKECENDLKIKLIKDTFIILKEEKNNPHHIDEEDYDHSLYQYHYPQEEEEVDAEHENKKLNLHFVHEPKPTYDHHQNYNYDDHEEYIKEYLPYHEYHHTEQPPPESSHQSEVINKYWPHPEQPSPMFGHHQDVNKQYLPHRSKRSITNHDDIDHDDETWKSNYELNENIHSATILPEDRWIAGCLIHCVLEKNNATDKQGWPTLDGLVAFYTDGVNEHDYFLQTLRFVDHCLKGASYRHGVHRYMTPERGQTCELSFDVFDCITDKITEYCSHK